MLTCAYYLVYVPKDLEISYGYATINTDVGSVQLSASGHLGVFGSCVHMRHAEVHISTRSGR
jgi:hypothetical protein